MIIKAVHILEVEADMADTIRGQVAYSQLHC